MVKYAPRKVYIRESGGYVELSYTEFCRCRESDQTYMDKLFIPIQGCLLEVVREQYTDFYRDKERWRYLQKLDTKNRLLSLDGFTDSEGNPLDFITDEAVDIAETVVNAVMVDRLKAALPLLSDSEQELIQAIFFDGLSEREVGARLGITQSVVNKRKARILIKLRKIIENSKFRLFNRRVKVLIRTLTDDSLCFLDRQWHIFFTEQILFDTIRIFFSVPWKINGFSPESSANRLNARINHARFWGSNISAASYAQWLKYLH
mgnify:CR=1 FL=1